MAAIIAILAFIIFTWFLSDASSYRKAKKKGKQAVKQYKDDKEQTNLKIAYGKGYNIKCPNCGRLHVNEITTTQRATSVAVFGLASGKIGKSYECPNCKYKW